MSFASSNLLVVAHLDNTITVNVNVNTFRAWLPSATPISWTNVSVRFDPTNYADRVNSATIQSGHCDECGAPMDVVWDCNTSEEFIDAPWICDLHNELVQVEEEPCNGSDICPCLACTNFRQSEAQFYLAERDILVVGHCSICLENQIIVRAKSLAHADLIASRDLICSDCRE